MLSHLEFTRDSLLVRYQASAAPQRVDIDVHLAGPVLIDFGSVFLRRVMDIVNFGAAGGSMFAPAAGAARVLEGPPAAPLGVTSFGPAHHWSVEIAGVAPVALRTFVEQLRQCGGFLQPVTSMALVGSLPLGDDEGAITERHVRAWLSDPDAYAEEWPAPGFPVRSRRITSGATLRIALKDEITPSLSEALRTLCVAWTNVASEYVSEWGELVTIVPEMAALPSFGMGRRELSARYLQFPRRRAASRAAIVNMLERFHRTAAPIAEVEVGI